MLDQEVILLIPKRKGDSGKNIEIYNLLLLVYYLIAVCFRS